MIHDIDGRGPWPPLETVIRRHGALTVLVAAARALVFRGRARRARLGELPDYLRRDVGLDPVEPGRAYWDFL